MVIVRESLYKLFIDEACLLVIYTHIIKKQEVFYGFLFRFEL